MKAAVISLGSESSKMTIEEMKKQFDAVDNINLKSVEVSLGYDKKPRLLYEGKPLEPYDCIYAKGSFWYAPILRSITEAVIDKTFVPLQPVAFTIGHDKILTHLTLQSYNIPMPPTYLASSAKAGKKILHDVNYPIVMKFPHGTQGIGVMFADSYGSASSMLDALIALKQPFLIQEFIDTDGTDYRAFVVGKEVVAAVKRVSTSGEMRANFHAGGAGVKTTLDTHSKRVAIDAAKACGADICGVDLLQGPKGPLVIEVNISPGIQGITQSTGVNVAEKIAKYLYSKTTEHKDVKQQKGTDKVFEDLGLTKTHAQQIISNLNFRADRILLPKMVTDITGFVESDEYVIKAEKGRVVIERI